MAFARGDTFHYGESNSTRHLHIVICESTRSSEPVIVVSVNTQHGWTDTTLVLQVGDHPYIKHPSSVSFGRVTTIPVSVLILADEASQRIAPGFRNFDHDSPVTPDLLKRVIQGALDSPLTPKGMKRAIRDRLGIPAPTLNL